MTDQFKVLPQVIQSPNDKREYLTLQLKNKVTAFLISDNECDKSAAAMNVDVGCLEDPDHRQGIAHFLEHMLFMGTQKYPQEGEFDAYLSKNGGWSNAYTDLMHTNYYFQCSNDGFEGAIDRFAQFFTTPLFDENCVDKEINAVNSEHEKNINSDSRRSFQLLRHSAKKGNAFGKFGTGNLETLKFDSIRDDLIEFYNKFYSANHMKLVIISDKSIEQQKQLVTELFSDIPNHNYERTKYTEIPFDKENLQNTYKINPVKDLDSIELMWIVENQLPLYKNQPAGYWSHIIGHEGQNSLFSKLKQEGYALEISTYPWNVMKLFTIFGLDITLTKKGLQNYEKVLQIVFSHLNFLRKQGAQEYIHKEIKQINKLKFDNLDKQKGTNYALSMARNLQLYEPQDIIQVSYMIQDFEKEKLNDFIQNQLRIDNCRIFFTSKSFEQECDLTEPVYKGKFKIENFSEKILNMFTSPQEFEELNFPPKNQYIPNSLELQTLENKDQNYPQKVYESDISVLYHKQDNTFLTPKALLKLSIYTNDNAICLLPEQDILCNLYTEVFNETLKEQQYLAEMAYLRSSFSFKQNQLVLTIQGFNDSFQNYLNNFLQFLSNFIKNSDDNKDLRKIFNNKLEQYQQDQKNFPLKAPYMQASQYLINLIKYQNQDAQLTQKLSETITFEKFQNFLKSFLKNFRFEVLTVGNFQQSQSIELVKSIEDFAKNQLKDTNILQKYDVPQIKSLKVSKEKHIIFTRTLPEQETNNCVIDYYQSSNKKTVKEYILTYFIENMISEPIYTELRTQQQLGYITYSAFTDINDVLGIKLQVQSDVKCPEYIQQRIQEFLDNYYEKSIKNLSDEEFQTFKNSIRDNIKEKDTNIVSEGNRYWTEIQKHRLMFDRKQQKLDFLETVQKSDIQSAFSDLFYKKSKKLSVHLVAPKYVEENNALKEKNNQKQNSDNKQVLYIDNFQQIKNMCQLYPDNIFI